MTDDEIEAASLKYNCAEVDPDCQPEDFPCWQHYSEHNSGQPITTWVVELATKLLEFRVRSLIFDHSNETHEKIRDASWLHMSIINRRWRDCVRHPFNFHPNDGKYEEVPEATIEAGRTLLSALGFKPKPPPEPLRRL